MWLTSGWQCCKKYLPPSGFLTCFFVTPAWFKWSDKCSYLTTITRVNTKCNEMRCSENSRDLSKGCWVLAGKWRLILSLEEQTSLRQQVSTKHKRRSSANRTRDWLQGRKKATLGSTQAWLSPITTTIWQRMAARAGAQVLAGHEQIRNMCVGWRAGNWETLTVGGVQEQRLGL